MSAEIVPIGRPDFRRPPGLPDSTTDLSILEAVKATLMGANEQKVAAILGVHPTTLPFHKISKEWQQIKAKLWPELRTLVHTDLVAARNLAIESLIDRLQNGDEVYNMMGESMGRKPLRAKDLVTILGKVNEVTGNLERDMGIATDDKDKLSLEQLAKSLKAFALAKDITEKAPQ